MQALTIILLCLTSIIGFGAETPVQMATLRWSGDGEFRSWRWENLGEAFEDGAARFAAESRIGSPRWAELDVLGAEVALRCSTNEPSRFLQVSFLRDDKVVSGPIRFEAAFAADTRETQTLAVSRAKHHVYGHWSVPTDSRWRTSSRIYPSDISCKPYRGSTNCL